MFWVLALNVRAKSDVACTCAIVLLHKQLTNYPSPVPCTHQNKYIYTVYIKTLTEIRIHLRAHSAQHQRKTWCFAPYDSAVRDSNLIRNLLHKKNIGTCSQACDKGVSELPPPLPLPFPSLPSAYPYHFQLNNWLSKVIYAFLALQLMYNLQQQKG